MTSIKGVNPLLVPLHGGGKLHKEKEEVDSAKLTEDNHFVSLGRHKNPAEFPCVNVTEVAALLVAAQGRRTAMAKPKYVSEDLKKTLKYCQRFKSVAKEDSTADLKQVRNNFLKRVEWEDRAGNIVKLPRVKEFEAAQLINLMPTTEEEATALVPTLGDNPFLKDILKELQELRKVEEER